MRLTRIVSLVLLLLVAACSQTAKPSFSVKRSTIDAVSEKTESKVRIVRPEVRDIDLPELYPFRPINKKDFFQLKIQDKAINDLSTTKDGLTVYTAGEDGTIREVTVSANRKEAHSRILLKSSEPFYSISLSPDSNYLAVAQNSLVVIYDLSEDAILHSLSRIAGGIRTVEWDPLREFVSLGRENGDVYVWNLTRGVDAGADSSKALELYREVPSAVEKIIFHPKGRSFFSVHQNGQTILWRLIRTEYEMGLRERDAKVDEESVGKAFRKALATGGRNNDAWLDYSGKFLFVATSQSAVYRLKVRGLQLVATLKHKENKQSALSGVELEGDRGFVASVGHDKRIHFWCFSPTAQHEIAVSPYFADSFTRIVSNQHSTLLWAAQKSGNLLGFDTEKFEDNKELLSLVDKECP